MSDPKFNPGDTIIAKNGSGSYYEIVRIADAKEWSGGPYYELDNGAVDIRKRARSGWHPVSKIDRTYKKVT